MVHDPEDVVQEFADIALVFEDMGAPNQLVRSVGHDPGLGEVVGEAAEDVRFSPMLAGVQGGDPFSVVLEDFGV